MNQLQIDCLPIKLG